jgi:hypothetical protein
MKALHKNYDKNLTLRPLRQKSAFYLTLRPEQKIEHCLSHELVRTENDMRLRRKVGERVVI